MLDLRCGNNHFLPTRQGEFLIAEQNNNMCLSFDWNSNSSSKVNCSHFVGKS